MGTSIVETIVEAFQTGATGLATGFTGFFDGLFKNAEGGLSTVAELAFAMVGVGLIVGISMGLVKKFTKKV